ncbi:MAG: HAMP domain-containing protein, partial [Clostridia bacterium]|nr:HAMP domain-containing protein [Clostridia bacterium]
MKTEGKTIRVKLILSIFASVGMAGISMLFLCFLMIVGSLSRQFTLFFASHVVEFTLSFLLIFLVLTIAFFLWLIRNNILYLEEIIKTLGVISKGDLDINIPIRTNDELGVMAETVNHMAYRLKGMIEEERRMEKTKN